MAAKTVLHLIETGGPGGAERMMVQLAAGLGSEYRSEAALIRDSWLGTALRMRGVPVKMLRHKSQGSFWKLRDVATLRDLVRVIRERRVAILHTHEFFMNTVGLVASLSTGVPLVATVHGKNYYADRFRRRVAYRLVGRFAGQMIAVSENIRSFLAEQVGIPSDQIRVVPNGIALDEEPPRERLSALRTALGLDQDSKVVGTVGSLYPVKGHTYLMDAIAPVVRRFAHVVFLIVGRGGLREELEARACGLGIARHLRFLGHREDVRDLLALCDVFVLPSLSEGMPLALLEAMAAGLSCVATKVGGISEVVDHGKTGLLVPPGDSHALAESIMTLLEDRTLARKMGGCARDAVARRFSLTKMVQAYQEIYAELVRTRERVRVQV